MAIDRSQLLRTVAVMNGKGGVGKTTLVTNLGGLLAQAGYRVLIVELDPQANVSEDLGTNDLGDGGQAILKSLLAGDALHPVRDVRPGLDVCLGGPALKDVEAALALRAMQSGPTARLALAASLAPLAGEYDIVLLDCPPGGIVLPGLAMGAARWVLIPTRSDASSRKGMREVAAEFVAARELNPGLEVLGVVLFGVASTATKVRERAFDSIAADLGGAAPVLTTVVRYAEAAAMDARDRGQLIHELEKTAADGPKWWEIRRGADAGEAVAASASTLAGDYQALGKEFVDLLAAAEAGAQEALA